MLAAVAEWNDLKLKVGYSVHFGATWCWLLFGQRLCWRGFLLLLMTHIARQRTCHRQQAHPYTFCCEYNRAVPACCENYSCSSTSCKMRLEKEKSMKSFSSLCTEQSFRRVGKNQGCLHEWLVGFSSRIKRLLIPSHIHASKSWKTNNQKQHKRHHQMPLKFGNLWVAKKKKHKIKSEP